MRKLHFFLILCMSVMISYGTVFADSLVIKNPSTGQSYQRIDAEIPWDSAKTECESLLGYLATITSQAENDFVYNNLGVDNWDFWLGATDGGVDIWEWVTGEPWVYTNWGTGQPNNYGGQQGCLSFWYQEASKWNDQTADPPRPNWGYICEWDAECTLAGDCEDSDACTVDQCVDYQCEYSPLDCDDSNECTDDSCNSLSGCVQSCNATGPEDLCCDDPACEGDPICDLAYPEQANTIAASYGKTSLVGSGVFNALALLLLPLGAVILLRSLRRRG